MRLMTNHWILKGQQELPVSSFSFKEISSKTTGTKRHREAGKYLKTRKAKCTAAFL